MVTYSQMLSIGRSAWLSEKPWLLERTAPDWGSNPSGKMERIFLSLLAPLLLPPMMLGMNRMRGAISTVVPK